MEQNQVITMTIGVIAILFILMNISRQSGNCAVNSDSINKITVTGNGKTSVVPDNIRYNVTFANNDESIATSQRNNFLKYLDQFESIADLTTNSYRNWTYEKNRRIQGTYNAQISFEASLEDGQKLSIPENTIFNYYFTVSDKLRNSVQEYIIFDAINNAKQQVEMSLKNIGKRNYDVINLIINPYSVPYFPMIRTSNAVESDNNLSSGEEDISITVSMTVSF